MSSLNHSVSGSALSFSLGSELALVRAQLATGAGGRAGRTLVKDGQLRVTMVGIAPGGAMKEHKADGPVTIQVLEGDIDLTLGARRYTVTTGMLFALEGGVRHGVQSPGGAVFLLTVVAAVPQEPATVIAAPTATVGESTTRVGGIAR